MSHNNIQDELRDLNSDLPANNNPFSVPEGYFEGLAGSVMAKIKSGNTGNSETAIEEIAILSPFLAGLSRTMPYTVPENFFQSTISELTILISEEKESEVLSFIDKSMPYQVPDSYFDLLPRSILSKVAPAQAKVIPIGRSNWKRMAVAAMITAIIGISGIFYFSNKSASKDPIAQVRNASTNDIEAFLRSTGASLSGSATAQNSSRKSEIKDMLQNVSDKDVDAFLKQVPEEEAITN
jgi:hypothetical protein